MDKQDITMDGVDALIEEVTRDEYLLNLADDTEAFRDQLNHMFVYTEEQLELTLEEVELLKGE